MAIAPNKVVIPKEYTTLIEGIGVLTAFTSTNTVTIDKTATDFSDINSDRPRYDMVGEFSYSFPTTTISVANASSSYRYLRLQISANNTLDRYRYIRFILKPNVTYRNIGTVAIPKLMFTFNFTYNGIRYNFNKNLTLVSIPPNSSIVTDTYSFLFDTVGKTLTDITASGTESWATE